MRLLSDHLSYPGVERVVGATVVSHLRWPPKNPFAVETQRGAVFHPECFGSDSPVQELIDHVPLVVAQGAEHSFDLYPSLLLFPIFLSLGVLLGLELSSFSRPLVDDPLHT